MGASIVLNHYGLIDNPRDIDLFIALEDIDKACEILNSLGEKKPQKCSEIYSTEHFNQYTINDNNVDLMAGFKINHKEGIYEYKFGSNSIDSTMNLNGIQIPLTSLEDWYILYQLIPGRDEKVRLIEDYLLKKESIEEEIIEKTLDGNLPKEVRERVQGLKGKVGGNY